MKEILLTQGKTALVDDDDFDNLNKYNWQYNNCGASRYFVKEKLRSKIYMHRQILNAPCNFEVDHIDRNRLNNQKNNLRLCARRENCYNRKRYNPLGVSGVNFDKKWNQYLARIRVNGKKIYLGHFNTLLDAALAYDDAAKFWFGEFACLNFPETQFTPNRYEL
jgi:hypothetical protein